MNCQQTQDLLKPLAEGMLQRDVLHQVREHLASCPECRAKLSPQDLVEILPHFDESIDPSDDFAERFYAELETRRRKPFHEKRHRMPGLRLPGPGRWFWQLAAAGILAVLIAAGLLVRQSAYRTPDPSAVFYELEVTENLPLLKDMTLISNMELLEDLETIENLHQLN